MAKILYFDCFAGASGDMVLGALLDAGLPLGELQAALGSLMIPGYSLSADRVLRSGLSATKFRLHEGEGGHAHDAHDHAHDHARDHGHEHGSTHTITSARAIMRMSTITPTVPRTTMRSTRTLTMPTAPSRRSPR